MASNFWIGADRHVPAARSLSGTVSYAWRPAGGRYALTLEAYAKRVRRAPECERIGIKYNFNDFYDIFRCTLWHFLRIFTAPTCCIPLFGFPLRARGRTAAAVC